MSDERKEAPEKKPEPEKEQTPAGTVLPDPNVSTNSKDDRSEKMKR